MAAEITDLLTQVALSTKTELSSPGYTEGATSINCEDLSAWQTIGALSAVYFAMDRVQTVTVNGQSVLQRINGTYTEWKGIVSGNTIGSLQLISGTDQDYPSGSGTRVYMTVSSAWANALVNGLLVTLNKDGSLKDLIVTADKIAAFAVTTGKLASASVTPNKMALGDDSASVATAETTTSTAFVDLTTVTDSVTVNVGANGRLLVIVSANAYVNVADGIGYVGFELSGANTLAADNARSAYRKVLGGQIDSRGVYITLLKGLNSGSTTVKMKYKVSGGTGTFSGREVTAIPL